MVIGNGLLAQAFKHYENDDQVIIFASGVSNSKEINENAFNREENLLKSLPKDKLLIYFSTCSIYDPSIDTAYTRHKRAMEMVVHYHSTQYIIFRLPNVVGPTNNPHTFFNFFKNKILSGEDLIILLMASRHLIGIEEVSYILSNIIEKEKSSKDLTKKALNVGLNNETMVSDIARMMLDILDKKNNIIIEPGGSNYSYDKGEFDEYLKSINYQTPDNYTYDLLKKYLI